MEVIEEEFKGSNTELVFTSTKTRSNTHQIQLIGVISHKSNCKHGFWSSGQFHSSDSVNILSSKL